MPKFKLILLAVIFILFAVFTGMQVSKTGMRSFFISFIITLFFGIFVFLFQTLYYIAVSRQFITNGYTTIEEYQSPIDIWLVSIPFCILMIVAYTWFHWYLVHVFFCTTLSLTGMLLGNGLGRGSGKWRFKKSLPFFFGVIFATLFRFIMDWMV